MAGKSKSDGLTALGLKKAIAAAQAAIVVGEKQPPVKVACGFGLSLWIQSETAGYWKLPYRFDGKQKTVSLGVCNLVKPDLAMARDKAAKAKAMLSDGVEPRQAKISERAAASVSLANTFAAVALAWHEKTLLSGQWKASHAARVMQRLKSELFPFLGVRPVDSLQTMDLLQPLESIIKRDTVNLAKTCRQYIGAIMRYAVQTGRIKSNPALDLDGAIVTRKPTHRPALALQAVPELLARLDNYVALASLKLAFRFALLTGVRSSEMNFARWPEFDLAAGVWTIPPEREPVEGIKNSERGEKMKRERVVYLSAQAVAIVKELQALNGRSVFVFQGRSLNVPISENSINSMLRKMGYDTKADICLHGFRTVMVSGLNESGQFTPDAIERHIGHEGGDKTGNIYKRNAQYLAERRRMLQWWADYVDALKVGYVAPDEFKTESDSPAPRLRIVA